MQNINNARAQKLEVYEPLSVKREGIRSATEGATLILELSPEPIHLRSPHPLEADTTSLRPVRTLLESAMSTIKFGKYEPSPTLIRRLNSSIEKTIPKTSEKTPDRIILEDLGSLCYKFERQIRARILRVCEGYYSISLTFGNLVEIF